MKEHKNLRIAGLCVVSRSVLALVTWIALCLFILTICATIVVTAFYREEALNETRCWFMDRKWVPPGNMAKNILWPYSACPVDPKCIKKEIEEFSCMRVTVIIELSENKTMEGMLHTDIKQRDIWEMCSDGDCSCSPKTVAMVTKERQRLDNKWREIHILTPAFKCFYSLTDVGAHSIIVKDKLYNQSDMVNSVIWPSIFLLGGIVTFLICTTKFYKEKIKKMEHKSVEDKENVSEEIYTNKAAVFKLEDSVTKTERIDNISGSQAWYMTFL